MVKPLPKGFSGPDGPSEADLYKCIHCGLCLESCPTYIETGLETESPRGRIALMKAVHEERLDLTDRVVEHLELCLQCRACEEVCPSGVPFGRLMEATRSQIASGRPQSILTKTIRVLVFRVLLPHLGLIRAMAWALKFYQRSGLQWIVREFRLLTPFGPFNSLEQQLPHLPKFFASSPRELLPDQGIALRRVGLLSGCVMPLAYGPVHEATVRVLTQNGCSVVVPRGQGCCGALNTHSGERKSARKLARDNIDAFLSAGVEAIIVNSAGCSATMKDYPELLKDDHAYSEKAKRFAELVKDVSEYLVKLPLKPPTKELKGLVTYQDSCHLARAQRIREAPREIIRAIPGLTFVEMESSDICCGAAGIYNITHRAMSREILSHKMQHVAATESNIIATSNPGCMLQLEVGVRQSGFPVRVAHVVELLDEAYR